MTTPLHQVGDWDVSALRVALHQLDGVAGGLLPWRTRLDALGRQLGAVDCWAGPAGTVAAAALVELSTVAAGVGAALDESLLSLQGLLAAAAEAQEEAAAAVAAAAAAEVVLDGAGQPVGLPLPPDPLLPPEQAAEVLATRQAGQLAAAAAADALAAAARAAACAVAAQEPPARVGVAGGGAVGLDDLVLRLAPAGRTVLPGLPADRGPETVAQWWAGLTAAEQLAEITLRPETVGGLEGLPAWARDQANRLQLETALGSSPAGSDQRATAEAVAAQLREEDDAGRTAQLLQFDAEGGLAAVALGDLDTAEAIGVLVPGINTTPADDLDGMLGDARDLASAAGAAAPGLAVATIAWLGYRTPGTAMALSPAASFRGGAALDSALDGLAASRTATGSGPAPRTTVLAHSYGTAVTGRAALAPGRLAADALVLLGSPGVPGGAAADLEVGEVYGAWSPADPVSWLDYFGDTPRDLSFGDLPLPVEPGQGHSDYYDRDRPTLGAMGRVVAGVVDGD